MNGVHVLVLSYEKLVINRGELRSAFTAVGADITVTVRSSVACFLPSVPPRRSTVGLFADSRNCTFVHVSPPLTVIDLGKAYEKFERVPGVTIIYA